MSDSDSYKDKDDFSDDPATNPSKAKPSDFNDPAKNPDEYNSNSGDGSEEEEEDKKRNEVRKEFSVDFETKIAKYIPPKIQFKGDLRKKSLVTAKQLDDKYPSQLIIFKNYFLYTAEGNLKILNKNLKLIFSEKIIDEDNELFSSFSLNNETIIIIASDKVRIINLIEKKTDDFGYEVIQEITETKFFCMGESLNNGYLLLAGGDRKYYFYELEKKNEKFGKENLYKLVGKVDDVHNVYDDDFPDLIDFNNGRILSWLNDDHNIKIIEYSPQLRIIKSKNGYQLHNAGLICDKYAILMGLTYPQYDSWLMDTETYDIVKHWITPQNDSFISSFFENKFFYSSTSRIALDEFIVKNGEFVRNNIYEVYYKEDKKESYEDRFSVRNILDETSFITSTWNGKVMIFKCDK